MCVGKHVQGYTWTEADTGHHPQWWVVVFFQDKVSLCSFDLGCRPGWPQTHRDPPVSAFQVLGLKACVSTAQFLLFVFENE